MDYQIYDISPLVTPEIAVFPGDTAFRRHVLLDMNKGDNLTLSSMTTTLHLGAHADAPSQCWNERDLRTPFSGIRESSLGGPKAATTPEVFSEVNA